MMTPAEVEANERFLERALGSAAPALMPSSYSYEMVSDNGSGPGLPRPASLAAYECGDIPAAASAAGEELYPDHVAVVSSEPGAYYDPHNDRIIIVYGDEESVI